MNAPPLLALLAVTAATAAAGTTAPGAVVAAAPPRCAVTATSDAGRWQRLPQPPSGLVSVGVLDGDACALVGAAADGRTWRSFDAGRTWTVSGAGVRVSGVRTEALGIPSADRLTWTGPVLGSGSPDTDPAGDVVRPLVSHDGGVTFIPAVLVVNGNRVDWRGSVIAAATATHYANNVPSGVLFAALRPATRPTPDLVRDVVEASSPSLLARSDDGGATFTPVSAAAQLAPTAVAVNPSIPDEIWVNDVRPGGTGSGVWVSTDAGATWTQACCDTPTTVRDISLASSDGGYTQVLLATDQGLLRSVDSGDTWETIREGAVTGVRTPADDPDTVIVATPGGVFSGEPRAKAFKPVPGLPSGCAPRGLRRHAGIPPVFLVECGASGGTYRLVLARYGGTSRVVGNPPPPVPSPTDNFAYTPLRELHELATWRLPGSNTGSGAIAFDGDTLYYDRVTPGELGMVDARTGAYLGTITTDLNVSGLTFDLRRDELLVTTSTLDLYAYALRTKTLRRLGAAPYKVPTYDAWYDGLAYVTEYHSRLSRAPRTGGPGVDVCTAYIVNATSQYEVNTSTYVAGGDGGGYIQDEGDNGLTRIDASCHVRGRYSHRVFSESGAENDAMACDTQSWFPQPAIWIRDSAPGTATAYGVPFGYCPMPSRLTVTAPVALHVGATGPVCARLVNATTGRPAARRGVVLSVNGAQLGHVETDADGTGCLPYTAPLVVPGVATLPVTAHFAGDAALYPSDAATQVTVFTEYPPPAPRPPVAIVVAPPPVPPVLPPAPLPNPGPVGVAQPVPAPAPNPAPAAQGQAQAQSIPQGVVVPQRQVQPQLVFAHARAVQREVVGDDAMTALPSGRERPLPSPGAAACGLLAACATATSAAYARARARR